MDNTLLLSYQIEYETTEISIEELKDKYDLKDIKGSEGWTKRNSLVSAQPKVPQLEQPVPELPQLPEQTLVPAQPTTSNEALMADIDEFKKEVVAKALDFIKNHAQYAEVKELKDMVAIVDSVEKSYKDTNTGPTINVLVQNLTERFQDDC